MQPQPPYGSVYASAVERNTPRIILRQCIIEIWKVMDLGVKMWVSLDQAFGTREYATVQENTANKKKKIEVMHILEAITRAGSQSLCLHDAAEVLGNTVVTHQEEVK